nr:hypothetical protein [Candidatus Sigynarchaeota archaeon]
MNEDERHGRWAFDTQGLPVFDHSASRGDEREPASFTTWGSSSTHFHLFGNTCWNALATNHGKVCMLDPRRALTLLGGDTSDHLGKESLGLGASLIRLQDNTIVSDIQDLSGSCLVQVRFGPGYVQKRTSCGTLLIETTLAIPPVSDPVLISVTKIKNTSPGLVRFDLCSFWDAFHYPLSKSLIVSWNRRIHYARNPHFNRLIKAAVALQRLVKADTDGARHRHAQQIRFSVVRKDGKIIVMQPIHKKGRKLSPLSPSNLNYHYKPVFLAALSETECVPVVEKSRHLDELFESPNRAREGNRIKNGKACLAFRSSMTVDGGQEKTFVFMFGCDDDANISRHIQKYGHVTDEMQLLDMIAGWFTRRAITLAIPGKDWLQREIFWHSSYLLGSSFKDEWWNLQRIPQGSVYLLGHGFDGSIRDFSLFVYPMIFMDPSMARESLLFIYSLVDRDGRIPYALHGFGKKLSIPFIHNNPSDQYFFVIWALTEYIYITRDYDILHENIGIHDEQRGLETATVKEQVSRLVRFVLSPEIGFGDHDMVHIKDGDWNDGITLMAEDRRAFVSNGESCFNAAMLAFSFDRAIPIITTFDPALAGIMSDALTRVETSIKGVWNGKWFYRGWDGKGNPLGDDTMFLDHHVWLMVNPKMAGAWMDVLVRNVKDELVARSKLGASIMFPPNERNSILPPGWDINGGTWHALNSLLAWGLRVQAPADALDFMERMSMHNKEKTYPGTWYGIWSGPDAYNADYADRPGEAFYHVATPMCDFPFGNNNLHGGMVSAAIRWAGIDARHEGITVDLSAGVPFSFKSAILDINFTPTSIHVVPGQNFKKNVDLAFKLLGNALDNVTVIQDGKQKAFTILENKVHVTHDLKNNGVPFEIKLRS